METGGGGAHRVETPRGGGEEEPENTAQLWGEVVYCLMLF